MNNNSNCGTRVVLSKTQRQITELTYISGETNFQD